MAKALSPTAAKLSYVLHRGIYPALGFLCFLFGAYGFYVQTRPPVDCSAQPGQIVHILPDGTVVVVESSEHESIESVAKRRGREVGQTLGSFTRGSTGPVRARLDRLYIGTHVDYRSAFRGHSEQLVALVERMSSRILDEKIETKFIVDKNTWQVIFRSKVLEEDENGRQALKYLLVGMHFAVIAPTERLKDILYLTKLEVERADDPTRPQQGVLGK